MVILAAAIIVPQGIHTIREGHVGVYFRGGAMLRAITQPGMHLKVPGVTQVYEIDVSMQTDNVENIPCGTSGGVMIYFDRVEVVNRLKPESVASTVKAYGINYDKFWIFDKIHHEINQFCSKHSLQEVYIEKFSTLDEALALALQRDCDIHAPGIEIVAIRVTKPRIPEAIQRNYERMEQTKTKLLVAQQRQRVVEKEAETERKTMLIQAQSDADISRIEQTQQVSEKGKEEDTAKLDNEMFLAKQKAHTDAEYYKQQKKAEANQAELTERFLQMHKFQALGAVPKVFYGEQALDLLQAADLPPSPSNAAATATSGRT